MRIFFGKNMVDEKIDGRNICIEVAEVIGDVGRASLNLKKIFKYNFFSKKYWNYKFLRSKEE